MKFFITLILFVSTAASAFAASKRPNVIFILTDDQGWGDAHFAGHPYVKTPNLDKFAAQSTWFRQFYVAATVCSPSRAAFMTSQSPARLQVHGHFSSHEANAARSMPDWLDPQVTTLPRLLRDAGYATAHIGKWHLGGNAGAPEPAAYGFDVCKTVDSNGPQLGDEKELYFRARSTRLMVDETIAFIRANKDRPFYANLWTLLPHASLQPTPEQLKEYESLAPKADDPAFGPWMQSYLAKAKDLKSQMQVFCASLTDLDAQMGRLFAALDEMGLAENTLIFYSSDNGPEDYRIANASNAGVGNTGPLRARKRSMHEGGIRTFGLLRWPGHVPAGRVDETTVTSGLDLLPTICKVVGVSLPASIKPDGEDVSDIWLGASRPRTAPLFWEWLFNVQGEADGYLPPMLSVRDGDWKLFVNHEGGSAQLYRIPEDPGEHHDLSKENPEVVASLTTKAVAWAKTLPPTPVRDQAIATGQPADRFLPKGKGQPNATKQLSAAERQAIFKRWDADHNGKLTLEEYAKGLPEKQEAPMRFKNFDTDGNGELSEAEFVKAGKP